MPLELYLTTKAAEPLSVVFNDTVVLDDLPAFYIVSPAVLEP
jgi:hypothetical protein